MLKYLFIGVIRGNFNFLFLLEHLIVLGSKLLSSISVKVLNPLSATKGAYNVSRVLGIL